MSKASKLLESANKSIYSKEGVDHINRIRESIAALSPCKETLEYIHEDAQKAGINMIFDLQFTGIVTHKDKI